MNGVWAIYQIISGKMAENEAVVYEINVGDELHSIFETPNAISNLPEGKNKSSTFNLVMVDVSGSMYTYWDSLMKYWNEYLAQLLPETENTKIFVFGGDVQFRRKGTSLEQSDFLQESTNLTDAIATINTEIHSSEENYVRLFLLTDGHHNATEIEPSVEIAKLSIPHEKTIEVFLLGFGSSFPVEYSITIRSALHNGNSNVPSLFWAQCDEHGIETDTDILHEIQSMTDIVKQGNVKFKIQPTGKLAPGFPDVDFTHYGEFIYFPKEPESISLSLHTEEDVPINLNISIKRVELRFLLDRVFRQWNSVIIQHHRKKLEVPTTAFDVMDKIYAYLYKKLAEELGKSYGNTNSIKHRLAKKDLKFLETEYATLMNQSKTVIGLEGQYASEIDLAEKILKTTVKSKYDTKNLKMKGYGIEEYNTDIEEFKKAFEQNWESITKLPEPSPDECCRVTMGSIIKDLQDPSFLDLLKEDKFTFMKTFTVTGIPAFAPVKGFAQISPWTMCIKKILKSPFTIISQSTLELSAEAGSQLSEDDKEIYLQEGEEESKFNIIVPVFTPEVANVLKPLVRTNIFAMLATFCTLKNPHIIDHNAHIALLGCTWMKHIDDWEGKNKPEYITESLVLIESTANLYVDRGGIAKYIDILLSEPQEALMTESAKEYGEKTIKCESLIKPMFLIHLARERKDVNENLLTIVPLLVLEFIGRCLAKFQTESNSQCIYSLLFIPGLGTLERREKYFEDKCKDTSNQILDSFKNEKGDLLKTYFIPEELRRSLKEFCRKYFKSVKSAVSNIKLNINLVEHWKNEASAGNIRLNSIKTFVAEFKLSEDTIKTIFDEKNIFVYVCHCLNHNTSKYRLSNPLPTYEEAFKKVTEMVEKENRKSFEAKSRKNVLEAAETKWREEYFLIHNNDVVVEPMTKQEVLHTAVEKGVVVSEENFGQIFRHNDKSGLIRNACMVKECPHYLIPNRTFNQHISIERTEEFAHQLHKISKETAAKDGNANDVISSILKNGYQSQNGLKIPKKPSGEHLQSMINKIDKLVDLYKKFSE